jgi:putative transposase
VKFVRSYRFKLEPDAEQESLFWQFAGVCRVVYNLGLEQRRVWGRKHKLGYVRQSADLTALRAEFDWIGRVYSSCQQQALRDLDKAFSNFYAGKGFPTPRKRGVNDSFRYSGREVGLKNLNAKWGSVRLPKIGWVKFRSTRAVPGVIKNATVRHSSDGWYLSLACEFEHSVSAPSADVVGVDRGVATTLALSTGETFSLPVGISKLDARRRRAQTVLSRRKKGSKRRERQRRKVARLHARSRRIRRDFHHRAALSVARRFGVVVMEKLNASAMSASASGTVENPGSRVSQKAGLNGAIRAAGWYAFSEVVADKLERRGGQVVFVDSRFTSQTCAACSVVDARSRESQARFICISCGHSDHADVNAAINIKRRWSTPLLDVEGCGYAPVEASTDSGLAATGNLRA